VDITSLTAFLDRKVTISALSAAGGALLTKLIALYRERIKVLEYRVSHDRVGLSAEDAIFGSVRVTWQGQELRNLYSSTLTVENATSVDYTNLRLKVYTGDTVLLNERSQIEGTPYAATWTDEYRQFLQVEGEAPTDAQFYAFRHSREYILPVFNRGHRLVVTYLTTVPIGDAGPAVWVDTLHPGVRLAFRPFTQHIHGVPVPIALPLGWLACLAILVLVSFYVQKVWLAALISLLCGLGVQSIGALMYRVFHFLKRVLLR
jgi:hypothetical protein